MAVFVQHFAGLRARTVVLTIVCSCFTALAAAQAVTGSSDGNIYIAGGVVRVEQAVGGDLVAAGGKISVERDVKGDAALAGGDVRVEGSMGGDLRAAGGNITIIGAIQGEVLGAGGNIELAPGAQVEGRMRLAAGNVRVAGTTAGDAAIYARNITVAGDIGGNARLVGETIEVLPGAHIRGRLSYSSPHAINAAANATIAGGVSRESYGHMPDVRRVWRVVAWIAGALFGIGVFVAGALLVLLIPDAIRRVEQTLTHASWLCLGTGLGLFLAIPFVALVLFVSIIGIPLGALLLALYPAVLLVGFLLAMLFVGDRGAAFMRKEANPSAAARVVALALTLIAFALMRALPLVGALVTAFAVLFGMGALAMTVYRHFSRPDHPTQAPTQQQAPPTLTGSAA
jgi:hypothetical protein